MHLRTNSASLELPDAEATKRLGAAVARICPPGVAVLLRGPLGAGKTTFVDGFAAALGAGRASSPTFVVAHRYVGGSVALWHLDFYRLDAREIDDLDVNEYLAADEITLVEWPERARFAWPKDRIEIDFCAAERGRRAELRAYGAARGAVDAAAGARR